MAYCANCGQPVKDTARFCESCGAQLKSEPTSAGPSNVKEGAKCRYCGLPLAGGDMVCRYCFRDNTLKKSEGVTKGVLIAGGIIVVVAGLFSFSVTTSLAIADIDSYSQNPTDFAVYWLLDLAAILAIVLGVQPIRRRHFGLSVAGGVCSLIGGAFFIGIFGLVLILLGRKGFKD